MRLYRTYRNNNQGHLVLILGIDAYHGDSAACLVDGGALVAAAEEERFQHIKHRAGLPVEAVSYCLREKGATLQNVGIIAINSDPSAW